MGYREDYFDSWRNGEVKCRGYLTLPEKIDNCKAVQYADKRAAELIADCEKIIKNMQEYRIDLARRYGELETMSYKRTLSLIREPRCWKSSTIHYYITITRIFEDKTEVEEYRAEYAGKERKKAFDEFEQLKKQNPGIETIKDIDKKSWER